MSELDQYRIIEKDLEANLARIKAKIAVLETKEIVFNNLDAAKENGYFEIGGHLRDATPEDIATDMNLYADACIEFSHEEMIPHIVEWKAK